MKIRAFEDTAHDYQTFQSFCKDFYSSGATQRSFDEELTMLTFKRILEKHENLKGFFIEDAAFSADVGYALVTSYWCNEDGGEIIVLDELYIAPQFRKKGFASQFLEWLEQYYRDSAVSITLEVLTTNVSACHLYSKEGFSPDGFTSLTKRILKRNFSASSDN